MKVKVPQSCLILCDPMDYIAYSPLYHIWNSPGQNTGVGSLSLLQGIFLTQELNQSLLHCRQILYQLSYQGAIYYCLLYKELLQINSKQQNKNMTRNYQTANSQAKNDW